MSKLLFFRQSGWMMIASTLGGALMFAVHKLATWPGRGMPEQEYAILLTLLQVLNQMAIPAAGLQMSFVQQTVAADSGSRARELVGAFRALMKATFIIWLAGATLVFLFQDQLVRDYKISNPAALWVTALIGLASLWTPILCGMLQGQQNFLWLGLASILNALTRVIAVGVIVLVLGGRAAGAMTGALLGMALALGVALWQTRAVWRGPAEQFLWRPWLKRMLPVTLGYGAATYMLTLDMIMVQGFFPKGDETAYYGAAGMIGRAVFFFLAPLTTVMFPKIARSAARSERTDVLTQALVVTALMGAAAALFCTFLPELPLRLIYPAGYLQAASLVPLFAWCMLPLPLASVLINNLLARERFGVVPWLVGVAIAYSFALRHAAQLQPQRFENVIWTLGAFGLLLLAGCIFFTWRERFRPGA